MILPTNNNNNNSENEGVAKRMTAMTTETQPQRRQP